MIGGFMGKWFCRLGKVAAAVALGMTFCAGCGQKDVGMPSEENVQGGITEDAREIAESDVEPAPEASEAPDGKAEAGKSTEEAEPEMQPVPKPWGKLTAGSAPIVSISSDGWEWSTQDGKYVLYEAYQDIVTVENAGFENLQAALAEYFPPVNEKEHEDFLRYAQEAYDEFDEEKENYFYNYYSWQSVELERSDSTVISFDESSSIYTGGMHPNGGCLGATFDVKTGRKLELADILKDEPGFYEAAVDYLTDWMARNFGEKSFGQEKRNYVASTFDEDRTVNWYLNGAGIVIIYNPYEVADHAAGTIEITLPYGLFYEYMKEEYTDPHTELIARVPENEDIAGLLGEESRIVVEKEDVFGSEARIVTDSSSEVAGEFFFLRNIYVIKRQDGRSFILVVGDYASDDNEMFVYEVTGGDIRQCDVLPGADLAGSSISTDKVSISLTINELGTYLATLEYTLDEDGKLICPEEIIPIESDRGMTVIKELPVTIGGTETVISGVSEYEYFEAIPYAG